MIIENPSQTIFLFSLYLIALAQAKARGFGSEWLEYEPMVGRICPTEPAKTLRLSVHLRKIPMIPSRRLCNQAAR